MLFEEPGKQCCVFDTMSLVKLCQLELGPRRAIEWLLDDFSVSIPKKVFDDGVRNLSDDDDERTVFFNAVLSCVAEPDAVFQEFVGKYVKHLPRNQRPNIDEGEEMATARALELSRFYKQYIVFVMDDYKAEPLLEKIFDLDQIGIVRNAYDLLLFLASRHSDELPIGEVEAALRELARLSRDNTKPAYITQKPDELRDQYLKTINQLSLTLP